MPHRIADVASLNMPFQTSRVDTWPSALPPCHTGSVPGKQAVASNCVHVASIACPTHGCHFVLQYVSDSLCHNLPSRVRLHGLRRFLCSCPLMTTASKTPLLPTRTPFFSSAGCFLHAFSLSFFPSWRGCVLSNAPARAWATPWLQPAPVQLVQGNTCHKPVSYVPSAEHDLLHHAHAPAALGATSSRAGFRTTRSVDSCRPPCLSAAHSTETESSRDRQHHMTVEDHRTCRKSSGHTDSRLSTGSVVGSLMRPPWATIPSCC